MIKNLMIFSMAAFFLVGCSHGGLRDSNRKNLISIDKGMNKSRVIEIMGMEGSGEVANPYKREIIKDRNGNEFDIFYYYTEHIGQKNWEEGVTPVVFKDGVVVGIGWRYIETSDLNMTVRRR